METNTHSDTLSVRQAWIDQQEHPKVVSAREILLKEADSVTFDPVPHVYRDKETGFEPVCVSDIVESFGAFDDEQKAGQIAERDYDNPNSKYYHMTAGQILSMWHAKRDAAAERGSQRHSFAEACLCVALGKPEEVEDQWKGRLSEDGLTIVALEPEEKAIVKAFNNMPDTLVPVVKECRLYNREFGYAGTLDLLVYDMESSAYALLDWKTNESLDKGHFNRMKDPFGDLWDTSLNHYVLQQSLYEIRLNQLGLQVIGRVLLHVRPDGVFTPVPIPEEKNTLLKVLRKRVENGLNAAGEKIAA